METSPLLFLKRCGVFLALLLVPSLVAADDRIKVEVVEASETTFHSGKTSMVIIMRKRWTLTTRLARHRVRNRRVQPRSWATIGRSVRETTF
jgi:hypothetical protein